ncbi:hypothetical protein RI367_006875 [Sorochytrium milnesiophthora]
MADYLASIYGTEKDKVNCSFYFKIGACRHGDRCSRKHVKPTFSQTVLINNVYNNPSHDPAVTMTPEQLQEHFDLFWEDFFIELAKYGEVEEMHVCDNVGDHLVGNVYVRYYQEEDAQKAVDGLNNRFYAGRPLYAELSPVTDFGEACCRQHENGECNRGGFCNFMHLKHESSSLRRELQESQRAMIRELRREREREREGPSRHSSNSRTRSRTPEEVSRLATAADDDPSEGSRHHRDRDRDRDRGRSSKDRERDRDRNEHHDRERERDRERARERDLADERERQAVMSGIYQEHHHPVAIKQEPDVYS